MVSLARLCAIVVQRKLREGQEGDKEGGESTDDEESRNEEEATK